MKITHRSGLGLMLRLWSGLELGLRLCLDKSLRSGVMVRARIRVRVRVNARVRVRVRVRIA